MSPTVLLCICLVATPEAAAGPPGADVILGDEAPYFTPRRVRVPAGTTVTWINRGPALVHTVMITSAAGPVSSGSIFPGKSWSHTFESEGVFRASCGVHPYMYGVVVVGDTDGETLSARGPGPDRDLKGARPGPASPAGGGSGAAAVARTGPPEHRPDDDTRAGGHQMARPEGRPAPTPVDQAAEFLEFELPVPGSVPGILEIDGEDSAWFTMGGGGWANITHPPQHLVGRLTIDGDFARFEMPTRGSGPSGLVIAPDRSIYVTELIAGKIARLDWARKLVQEFPLRSEASWPTGLALDRGGNLWFSMTRANKIGRLAPGGAIREFPMPTAGAHPTGLALDDRGNVWVAERDGGKIACLRTDGVMVEYALPTPRAKPSGIAVDDRGRVWFAERNGNAIGVVDGDSIREYPLPNPNSAPFFVRVDYAGRIWFTEVFGNRIGVLDPETGSIREYAVPTRDAWPGGLAIDSQGNVWFTEQLANKVGVLVAPGRARTGAAAGRGGAGQGAPSGRGPGARAEGSHSERGDRRGD